MGFWQRLLWLEDKTEPVRVALVGEKSQERKLLEQAYQQNPHIQVIYTSQEINPEKISREVELVEIFAPPKETSELAEEFLKKRFNISVGMPPALSLEEINFLQELSQKHQNWVRVRNPCFYYQPFQKACEIIKKEKLGYPLMLRLIVKRSPKPEDGLDWGKWILEKESDFLALAEELYGPIEKVFAMSNSENSKEIGSIIIGFKFQAQHRMGYLLLDFASQLHIRTFTFPVFRQLWATGTAGVLMINRGEGQLWRVPPLLLRAKNYSHTYENLKDSWQDAYSEMVKEVAVSLRKNLHPGFGLSRAKRGLIIALSVQASLEQKREIPLSQPLS